MLFDTSNGAGERVMVLESYQLVRFKKSPGTHVAHIGASNYWQHAAEEILVAFEITARATLEEAPR